MKEHEDNNYDTKIEWDKCIGCYDYIHRPGDLIHCYSFCFPEIREQVKYKCPCLDCIVKVICNRECKDFEMYNLIVEDIYWKNNEREK